MIMAVTITLEPEIEARFRYEAAQSGLTLEQFTAQRLLEAELLWRIRTAVPESETRLLHRLLRQHKKKPLAETELVQLQTLLDAREERSAQRLLDLGQLARFRSISVRELMAQLGIRPIVSP